MLDKRIEIKVCGITDKSEIKILNDQRVDYAGFIFAESIRNVTGERAAGLVKGLNESILKVGVFTRICIDEINKLVSGGVIDIVQLHLSDLTGIGRINAPVWVSVGVGKEEIPFLREIEEYAEGIHLDTYDKKLAGGTGRPFDWELVKGFTTDKKLILAGGLDHSNIQSALMKINADVVDLNSGAEIVRNGIRIKSAVLVEKFIKEVRKYEKYR